MNSLDLNTSTCSYAHFQSSKNPLRALAEVAITRLESLRHSVRSHNPHHPELFHQHENHVTDGRPLNHFSTSYLPHTESKLVPVKPLSNGEQQNPTEDIQFEVTESFCSDKTVALEPGKALISGLDNADQANKQVKAVRNKTNRAKQQVKPVRNKTNRAKQQAKPVRIRMNKARQQANYLATDRGKQVRASYHASLKAKELSAIRTARKNARRAAIRKGYNPELVNQIADLAAEKKKESLLSGTSFRFPVTKLKEMIQCQQQDQGISN